VVVFLLPLNNGSFAEYRRPYAVYYRHDVAFRYFHSLIADYDTIIERKNSAMGKYLVAFGVCRLYDYFVQIDKELQIQKPFS